jgi:flavin reductase (DIM6/NTAB) family NADH-FMN oxidoreductase RutF
MEPKWNDSFSKVEINSLELQVFSKIANEWFLITAGEINKLNTMTASWGTMGILWNKPVFICFIRPTRHTFSFVEDSDVFTISFLDKEYKKILNVCGSVSGRNTDKIQSTGLIPVGLEAGGISFQQANQIFECRKIYFDDLKPVFFIPDEIDDRHYPDKDYHRMYIGEITSVYKKS